MKYPGIQKIIDVLNKVDDSSESEMGFDMCHWYGDRGESRHPCGTACCIAGWAHSISSDLRQSSIEAFVDFCDLQNVSDTIINRLTMPNVTLSDLTLPMAIKVLEIFRDTGEVEWRKVIFGKV